jgi:hypothetical protein
MQIHIDSNHAVPVAAVPVAGDDVTDDDATVTSEPNENLSTPHLSLQLAKASEFLFHHILDEETMVCLPKHVKT